MNNLLIFFLKGLRKIYQKAFKDNQLPSLQKEEDPDKVSEMIYNLLQRDEPCMIARFGSTELSAIVNYLGVTSQKHAVWKFIKGEQPEWWWNLNIMKQMQECAGFFPSTPHNLMKFGKLMLEDAKEVDILGSWLQNEAHLKKELKQAQMVRFTFLDPFWSKKSWTKALENKKVLVIHPFEKTIRTQYQKREFLFENKDILPSFELSTIKAIQSLGGDSNGFTDWFEALDYMKREMDKIDYDICLIGCGAYGFPLAAHAKRQGKKAVHLGGILQFLFGIIGRRWENPNYNDKYDYSQFINQYWVRPSEEEKAKNANKVENACYW